ncbi:MAG: TraR/DksA family transcriptional regulator [Bacteriovoracaceae bacterium]|nr:TraR/DksA family transcriptional regulator [Bacteriovoracaceae bacterium]
MFNFEELLNNRKKEILDGLKSIEAVARPVDLKEPIGRLSRVDAIQQQQMALNAKKQLETNLLLVDQAIQRLKRGDYGICLSCEEEIDEKRLIAKPEAPFCIKCQK